MLDRLDRKVKAGLVAYRLGLGELADTATQKSIVQAGNKAGGKTNTFVKRRVAKAMGVSQKFIKTHSKTTPFKVIKAKASGKLPAQGAEITVRVSGQRIRLIHFGAKEKSTKRAGKQGVAVKVWGQRKVYKSAFVAPVKYSGGATDGVFVRSTAKSLPIKQLYGPGAAREAERHEADVIAKFNAEMVAILPNQLKFNISKAMARKPLRNG